MAIPNKSYNNIIYFLARLGQYHEQIESVSVGDIYDMDLSKETLFPLMHINPLNVTTGESELLYNFQIFLKMALPKDKYLRYKRLLIQV